MINLVYREIPKHFSFVLLKKLLINMLKQKKCVSYYVWVSMNKGGL